MNHGTQNNIGHHYNGAGAETKATIQATPGIRQLDAATKGRERSFKRQAKISTHNHAAGAFLKHSFLPKMPVRDFNEAPEINNIERDFYKSLSQLADHYNIVLKETHSFGYPYNISLALHDAKEKLKEVEHWSDLQLIHDESTYLVSEEKFHTGFDLYYIPVQPLYIILRDRKHRKAAQLLLSVCSYLYHVADIPYYTEEDSFMYWQYDMITNMIEDQEELEELGYSEQFTGEMKQANWIGERVEQIIFNLKTLNVLEQRLLRFNAKSEFEIECYKLASQALALYKEYPKASIFRNTSDEDDCVYGHEAEILCMDKRVSFIANDRGPLFDCLCEYVNHEMNEYAESDEPTIVKRFDSNPIPDMNFDFETRIFSLLDNLCGLFNTYQLKK